MNYYYRVRTKSYTVLFQSQMPTQWILMNWLSTLLIVSLLTVIANGQSAWKAIVALSAFSSWIENVIKSNYCNNIKFEYLAPELNLGWLNIYIFFNPILLILIRKPSFKTVSRWTSHALNFGFLFPSYASCNTQWYGVQRKNSSYSHSLQETGTWTQMWCDVMSCACAELTAVKWLIYSSQQHTWVKAHLPHCLQDSNWAFSLFFLMLQWCPQSNPVIFVWITPFANVWAINSCSLTQGLNYVVLSFLSRIYMKFT